MQLSTSTLVSFNHSIGDKMDKLRFIKTRDVKSPCRAHDDDAGVDFFVPNKIHYSEFENGSNKYQKHNIRIWHDDEGNVEKIFLEPGQSVNIPSGIKLKIPHGHALIFFNKSGVGMKKQLDVLACVVDESYQNEVHINLVNNGNLTQEINAGDKIIQGVVLPVNYCMPEEAKDIDDLYDGVVTSRGLGGFGSSGTK